MPPKKKGKNISPIVVGTVSTRSTRRQSIVNIEIPKLSRSKTRNVQGLEKQSENLCEQIKASYNKVVGSGDKKETSLLPIVMSQDSTKPIEVSCLSVGSDNKELLQILEDWSDEDSQENKKISPIDKSHARNDNFNYCKTKMKINSTTNDLEDIKHFRDKELDISEIKGEAQSKEELIETCVYPHTDCGNDENCSIIANDNVNYMIVNDQMEEVKVDLTLSDSLCDNIQSQVEVSLETDETHVNLPIQGTCTEVEATVLQIVAFNEEMNPNLSKDVFLHKNVIPHNRQYDELKIRNQRTMKEKSNVLCEDDSMSDSENHQLNQADLRDTFHSEETVQSFSTTDSNDSEVRRYFAKEIDKNEIIVQLTTERTIVNDNIELDNKKDFNEENYSNPNKQFDGQMMANEVIEECVTLGDSRKESEANCHENKSVKNVLKIADDRNTTCQQRADISQMSICDSECDQKKKKLNSIDEQLKNVGEGLEVTNKTVKIIESDFLNTNHIMQESLLQEVDNMSQKISDTATLAQKVAALNIEVSKTSKQKCTKGMSKKDTKSVNKKTEISKNTTKISTNMQITEHFEQMNLTGKQDSQFRRKQKTSRASNTQQVSKKQLQKHSKNKGKEDILRKSSTEILNKFSEPIIDKASLGTSLLKEKKNSDIRSIKKQPSILGSQFKIKISSNNNKPKNSSKKVETKMKTENVKKNYQQEVNIFKDNFNKSNPHKSKTGRDIIKKADQQEIKHEKEPFHKYDQEENRTAQSKKQDLCETSIIHTMCKIENENKSEAEGEDVEIRRSSRIKSINVMKKKTIGHGLVRSKSEISLNESDISDNNSLVQETEKETPFSTPSTSPKHNIRERKTRWSKSVENLVGEIPPNSEWITSQDIVELDEKQRFSTKDDPVVEARLKQFVHLKENIYKTSRMTCKEAKKMTCDCFLTQEDILANEFGCGEDCLNRLLLIECGNLCQVGDRCTNKRFQKGQFAPVEVFNTEKKGLGLRAAANIPFGEFILEYVGEVLNNDEFDKRAEVYSQDKNIHYYFMALRADAIIDATVKGNISRFINHSCDPNAETQKWTVNGELRIGFFSTRTILAGEEITFDYRFQRYGKEAQKCFCGAAICRGWLGEEPDEESEEEDDEEEDEIMETAEASQTVELSENDVEKTEDSFKELQLVKKTVTSDEIKTQEELRSTEKAKSDVKSECVTAETTSSSVTQEKKYIKKKISKKKPRVELFEEIDQLNEEIEMLVATGLKNQAHTLRLSRLMVRAQAPQQRTKLLRVLRRGELPCRRLFLDYHGLRLMHGYMIDAQHLVLKEKKYESLRLEMLQTLAVLPIPNKTMLQDSKVLPTVEKWASNKNVTSPLDSDSNSPKTDTDLSEVNKKHLKEEEQKAGEKVPERIIEDQEEEIRFLASKLLEEWKNLKEVFRIPKKERIEQMKEHEREANKKFMQSGYGQEQDKNKKINELRYRGASSKFKYERDNYRKSSKNNEQYSAEFMKLSKIERRKLFAIQHELKEEERRLKQRELWRQHEVNCLMIGTDPRFTAPFDPSKPYQCIWNPQLGQWQTYPLPQNSPLITPQPPQPNTNHVLPQNPKSMPSYFTQPPLPSNSTINTNIQQLSTTTIPSSAQSTTINIPHNPHISTLGSFAGLSNPSNSMLSTHTPHTQHPSVSLPPNNISLAIPKDQKLKEEDPCQVRFLGPIPPPVKLPPKWKCAKDKYGRPYYYHVKIRKSQWEPPSHPDTPVADEAEFSESESSSDSSSESSGTTSENSDSEEDIDDTKLLMEVRKQIEKTASHSKKNIPYQTQKAQLSTSSPDIKFSGESDMEVDHDHSVSVPTGDDETQRPSIDIRLKEQFNLKDDKPPKKKRRVGLCEEIIISPRSEDDKLQFREDLKRYKANKEKLRRQKELIIQQTRRQLKEVEQQRKAKEKRSRPSLKVKIKDMADFHSEDAKKIKETFRANMASTVVSSLNAYRKSDCKEGRITNTDDFKHLARKLTHFVMLKEMKHIAKIEDLLCTDNVKMKAREYIRKYMNKFGEVYIKRNDSPDFKD